MKRRGPRLGEAPGTRMQPRARAAWSRLPPGRLNWELRRLLGLRGAPRARPGPGASARRDPIDGERLHWGFLGLQCGSPGASRFSPGASRFSPHGPRAPLYHSCHRGAGSRPKTPQWPALSRGEAWPRVGLSPGLLAPPPKKNSF